MVRRLVRTLGLRRLFAAPPNHRSADDRDRTAVPRRGQASLDSADRGHNIAGRNDRYRVTGRNVSDESDSVLSAGLLIGAADGLRQPQDQWQGPAPIERSEHRTARMIPPILDTESLAQTTTSLSLDKPVSAANRFVSRDTNCPL